MSDLWPALVETLNRYGDAFAGFAVAMFVQVSVLVAALLVIDRVLLHNVRAVVRYGLWTLVLVKLLLPVGLRTPTSVAYWLPTPRAAFAPFDARSSAIGGTTEMSSSRDINGASIAREIGVDQHSAMEIPNEPNITAVPEAARAGSSHAAVPPARLSLLAGALVGWLAIVLALFAVLWRRSVLVRRLVRQTVDAPGELQTLLGDCLAVVGMPRLHVQIKISSQLGSPAVCGLWRPTILLPSLLVRKLDRQQLRLVFMHELVHWKRFDLQINCLQTVLQILYFYSPAVWVANAMLRRLREHAVDEAVLVACRPQADRYGALLIDIAALAFNRSETMLRLIGVVESRTALAGRIRRIASRPIPTSARLGLPGALSIFVVGVALLPMAGRETTAAAGESPNGEQAKSRAETAETGAEQIESKPVTNTAEPGGKPGEIRGRIVHADGTPAVDADIRLLEGIDTIYDAKRKRQNTRSDERGDFAFQGLSPGPNLIRAFLDNESTRTQRYKFEKVVLDAQGRQTAPLELMLKAAVRLRVRVTSQTTGAPLPDATLQFVWSDKDDDIKANDQGEIVAEALTAEQWHVQITAPGYACDIRDVQLNAPETAFDVSLSPGGEITGRVVDAQGKPVSGAKLRAGLENQSMYSLDKATTDEMGRYRLRHLPQRVPVKISASHDGFLHADETVSVANSEPVERGDLQLTPTPSGGTAKGQVVDSAGKPIAGASLENIGNSTADRIAATTDAQGRFQIAKLFARRDDQVFLTIRGPGVAPQQIQLTESERNGGPLTVAIEPGHRIRGRVMNRADEPVAACEVFYAEGNLGFNAVGGKLVTDAQGHFDSDSLPADCPFTFRASGYSELLDQKLPLDGGEEVIVRLEPIGLLRGQLVDGSTGKSIREFNVRITFPSRSEPGDKRLGGITSTRINPGENFVTADGRFELQDLINGTVFDLLVQAQGYHPTRVERATVGTKESAQTISIKLDLVREGDYFKVAGNIALADGKPAAAVQVRLMGWRDGGELSTEPIFNWVAVESGSLADRYLEYRNAVTDAQGTFSFDKMPKGLALRLVYWSDAVPATRMDHLEDSPAEEIVRLRLRPDAAVTIHGTIDRSAFPDAAAVATAGDFNVYFNRQRALKENQADFELTGVQAGKSYVILQGKLRPSDQFPGMQTIDTIASVEVTPVAGETITVNFDKSTRSRTPVRRK